MSRRLLLSCQRAPPRSRGVRHASRVAPFEALSLRLLVLLWSLARSAASGGRRRAVHITFTLQARVHSGHRVGDVVDVEGLAHDCHGEYRENMSGGLD